ncbi:inositol monophosphatase [soil metagenome]
MDETDILRRHLVAQGIVRQAGQQAASQYRRRDELAVERKGTQDLVSEADRACEDAIVGALSVCFPDDSFLGEERGLQNEGGDAVWIIDPIDGTANFLRGIPIWCVSLGLMVRGEPMAGIIYNPVTEEFYSATKGRGALLNGKPIAVSKAASLDEARIGVGFSYRRPIDPHLAGIKACLEAHCEYSRLGSGALGLAQTADGRFEGYWEQHINMWDVAAGIVIVREAGGYVNDFLANDGFNEGNVILAAAPALAPALRELLLHQH